MILDIFIWKGLCIETMKNLKHSKYKNTAILFEILVRKLTSESLTSDKSVTVNIIKKYFGKNTELSKELQLYNSLIKEQLNSEAKALDFIRTCKTAHNHLNKSILKRQRYNLVKEISENFDFNKISKIRINNYKTLASLYKIFEYNEVDNPKQLFECKNEVVAHMMIQESSKPTADKVIESYKSQNQDTRLLAYKLMIDKFNKKCDRYTKITNFEELCTYLNNPERTKFLDRFSGFKKMVQERMIEIFLESKSISVLLTINWKGKSWEIFIVV